MSPQDEMSKRLLELARGGHDPNDFDVRRVRASLHMRYLAAPIPATATTAHGFKAATKLVFSKVLIPMTMGIGIGAVGTVGAPYLFGQAPHPGASMVASRVAQTAKVDVAPILEQSPVLQQVAEPLNTRSGSASTLGPLAPPQSSPPPGPVSPLSHEDMQTELDGLRRAQRLLRTGQPEKSLAALDELALRVPSGGLMEERAAVRAMARCGSGERGRTEAEAFFAQYPNSVHTMSVRSACASASFDLFTNKETEVEHLKH